MARNNKDKIENIREIDKLIKKINEAEKDSRTGEEVQKEADNVFEDTEDEMIDNGKLEQANYNEEYDSDEHDSNEHDSDEHDSNEYDSDDDIKPKEQLTKSNKQDQEEDDEDIDANIDEDSEGVSADKEAQDDTDSETNIQEEYKKGVEVVNNAIEKIKSVVKTSTLAIKVLVNPITLKIIALLIAVTYLISATQVIGKNDYNIACSSSGVGIVSISDDADDFTRQSAIVAWLTSTPFEHFGNKPMTREQAIGVMGNLMQESYHANNKAFEGDHSITAWETWTNEKILAEFGSQSNQGIGLIQWDSGRRVKLIEYANSLNKPWYDLNTQLSFLKIELDGPHGETLNEKGFTDTTKTIDEYVELWDKHFEISDGKSTNKRIEYAKDFESKYKGGAGLASNCIGVGVDTTNLVELAIQSAWPNRQASSSHGTCPLIHQGQCGESFAKPEYIAAKRIAEERTGNDPARDLFASCDRFVASMLRASGTDENFPWGGVVAQHDYMTSSDSWQEISCQDRMPGDVVIRRDGSLGGYGHIMLYLGNVDGKDSTASASHPGSPTGKARTAAIYGTSCQGDLFIGDGHPAQGFRKVK